MQKYNNRNEVPEEYKWDLTPFFKNENEFYDNLDKCKKMIAELKDYVGCTKDANNLYEFLGKQINAIALWEDLYVYANLVNDQELGDDSSIKMKNASENLLNEYNLNTSFFAPELLKLTKEEYDRLYEFESLMEFKDDLDRIYREKEHILTENEEKIVSELVNAMDHYDDMSSTMLNSEHNYGKIKLSSGEVVTVATNNYRVLMKDKDVSVRKKVYNQFNKTLEQYGATSASLLNSYVSMNEAIAKINYIRKYLKDVTIIPVPKEVSKTNMVRAKDSILIDDFTGNLDEWEDNGGIGVKFSKENKKTKYINITNLSEILALDIDKC